MSSQQRAEAAIRAFPWGDYGLDNVRRADDEWVPVLAAVVLEAVFGSADEVAERQSDVLERLRRSIGRRRPGQNALEPSGPAPSTPEPVSAPTAGDGGTESAPASTPRPAESAGERLVPGSTYEGHSSLSVDLRPSGGPVPSRSLPGGER